jgi:prepilin-type N-terminal cleavage/methylation domain-containing protein
MPNRPMPNFPLPPAPPSRRGVATHSHSPLATRHSALRMHSHSAFGSRHSAFPHSPFPRAFTLIELLVVIGLLVLLLAMAVPAFNYITGARSVESARNMVNAMLGRMRLAALSTGTPCGVIFYVDQATGRTTMATVSVTSDASGGTLGAGGLAADKMPQYKQYDNTATYLGPDANPPTVPRDRPDAPDEAFYITLDYTPAGTYAAEGGRPVVKHYVRKSPMSRQPATGVAPPLTNQPVDSVSYWPAENPAPNAWIELVAGNVEFGSLNAALTDVSEVQALPAGVGVQVVVDPNGIANGERYLRTGVIAFDAQGNLTISPLVLSGTSELGAAVGAPNKPAIIRSTANWTSGIGVAFYDQQTFVTKRFTDGDTKFQILDLAPAGSGGPAETGPTGSGSEEEWIDQEADVLLINRSTGALMVNQ